MSHTPGPDGYRDGVNRHGDLLITARAAIAKARGQELKGGK